MVSLLKIFFIIILLTSLHFSQNPKIKIDNLTKDDGLSANNVLCMLQDSKGFMWFGTNNGLNKYDGNRFTIYKYDPDDPFSISHNFVRAICEDKNGNIWIGTYGGGLNKFDPETERFTRFIKTDNNVNSFCDNFILSNGLFEDHKGNIWVGTNNGLCHIITEENEKTAKQYKFIQYKHNIIDKDNYHHNVIHSIYEDKNHNIWIGAQDGSISLVNPNEKQLSKIITSDDIYNFMNPKNTKWDPGAVRTIYHNLTDRDSILVFGTSKNFYKYDMIRNRFISYDNNLWDIWKRKFINRVNTYHLNADGSLWVGSNKGLFLLDSKLNKFDFYNNDPKDPSSLNDININSFYKDRQGILWIGTNGRGIYKYNQKEHKFIYHELTLAKNRYNIWSICEDRSDTNRILWLGTESQGLLKYNLITKDVIQFPLKIKDPITTLFLDNIDNNILWIGTYGSGFFKIDKYRKEIIKQYFPSEGIHPKVDVHNFAASNLIFSIVPGKKGNIWIGTMYGLYQFNPRTEVITPYLHEPQNSNSLSNNKIYVIYNSLYKDESVLWIGTFAGGLNKFIPKSNSFIRYKNDPNDPKALNANNVTAIFEDNSGTLWIGTTKGLKKFNRESETFTHIMDSDKKLSLEIVAIYKDKYMNLWLNTKADLYNYNLKSNILRTFNENDGLINGINNRFSSYRNQEGKWFLGGSGGIIEYDPAYYQDNNNIPPVTLTDFQIYNKSITPGKNSPLSKTISNTDEIILDFDQSVFSFEFAALDYYNPSKNKYAYKMQGFDSDWVFTDASRRFATYTNLDPGEYTFIVKGSNNDGIWNEEGTSVKIIITPPWWRTIWAYSIYLLLFIGTLYALRKYDLKQQCLKQELAIKNEHAEKLEELDRLKSRFFTNISHEFRTPLTLIKGPAKLISDKAENLEIKDNAVLIERNSEKLNKLVTQLLDLARLEAGEMNLRAGLVNIVSLVKEIVDSFASYADSKKISISFSSNEKKIFVYVDKDKLEKIINNILSNAFKYTASNGKINIEIIRKRKIVEINISDTGIGISKDLIPKIFNRFYQVDQNQNKHQEGTGIGLALTRELILLHKGEIDLESEEGKGTTFFIRLPLGKKHLTPDQICEPEKNEGIDLFDKKVPVSITSNENNNGKDLLLKHTGKPLLLIVEDNADVRKYVNNFLSNEYEIMEAINGEDGFNQSVNHMPDIIISDVMMPNMDGFQLTEKLKKDDRTSHIPIILLTAKASSKDKIEGYETGADDYIMKPFDAKELKVRVKNLIEQRKIIRQHFQKESFFSLEEKKISSVDKSFLEKAVSIINKHLSDTSFGVDSFAKELAISRVSLYKKILALVGEPPVDLIKRIRLSKAAILLKNNTGNISETALEVGFNNPAYFSECFKKQFGVTPSNYQGNSVNP